jgi:hypothetical protein
LIDLYKFLSFSPFVVITQQVHWVCSQLLSTPESDLIIL